VRVAKRNTIPDRLEDDFERFETELHLCLRRCSPYERERFERLLTAFAALKERAGAVLPSRRDGSAADTAVDDVAADAVTSAAPGVEVISVSAELAAVFTKAGHGWSFHGWQPATHHAATPNINLPVIDGRDFPTLEEAAAHVCRVLLDAGHSG
jgi:hypothetical protein